MAAVAKEERNSRADCFRRTRAFGKVQGLPILEDGIVDLLAGRVGSDLDVD